VHAILGSQTCTSGPLLLTECSEETKSASFWRASQALAAHMPAVLQRGMSRKSTTQPWKQDSPEEQAFQQVLSRLPYGAVHFNDADMETAWIG